MWKVIIVCIVLMLNLSFCSAAVPDNLNAVLQQSKDINMLFKIGINHGEYTTRYQRLYLDAMKLQESNPEYKDDLNALLEVYADTGDCWQYYIRERSIFISSQGMMYKKLDQKYPELFIKVPPHSNQWAITEVLLCLPTVYAVEQVKLIESKYNQ
jgi:hypothetical protein